MISTHFTRVAATASALGLFALVHGEVWAKPPAIPLPDRNPKRSEGTAVQAPPAEKETETAAQVQREVLANVPLPHRNPNRTGPPMVQLPRAEGEPKLTEQTRAGVLTKVPALLEYDISKKEQASVKAAINHIYKRRFDKARAHMRQIKDKTALKLATWYYYRRRGNDANPADIERFRLENPDWPSQTRLRHNAEEVLLKEKAPANTVFAFFESSKPTTGAGKAALGGAYLSSGDKEKAERLVQEAWRKHDFAEDIEKIILDRFGELLDVKDHKARIDRLLLLDRKSKIASVKRTAEHLSDEEKKRIEARIAVVRRLKKAKQLLAAVKEEDVKEDVGFYFSRIQWLRRHKKEEEAWKLLLAAPRDPEQLIAINEWWIERRVNCRQALNAGKPEIAYQIAKNHELLSGYHYDEAKFLSGWIALRFLSKPEEALEHFQALRTAAKSPKQISRAEYWLGRTATVLGEPENAASHYREAAKHQLTYYGQLAAQTLKPGHGPLTLPPAPEPTQADFDKFSARDSVKAIALVREIDLEKLAPLFFHQLARTVDTPGEGVLLAEMAREMVQPHASVRLSKIAFNRGLPLAEYAYPTNMMPEYKQINVPVEPALLYALSRQESEFNPKAQSPVGARGLMQIMPGTARAIARQHKVRYRRADLTKNPSYNVMLGVAHLGDLLADYNGSYILTLVAYNAGGGRVRDWTKEFGDPRAKDVDAIDWVERIPFTETRNYVKKILTSLQIFRARLEGTDKALRLVEDLNRGYSDQSAETEAPAEENTPKTQ